jgi:hypothetical protein
MDTPTFVVASAPPAAASDSIRIRLFFMVFQMSLRGGRGATGTGQCGCDAVFGLSDIHAVGCRTTGHAGAQLFGNTTAFRPLGARADA